MTDAVPEAYKAMGVPLDETEEIAGSLIVSRTGTKKGEHKAYEILSKCDTTYRLYQPSLGSKHCIEFMRQRLLIEYHT